MAEDHWSIRRAEQGGVSEIAQVGWQNSSAPDVAELRFLGFFLSQCDFSLICAFFVSHFALCCNFSATRNHYTACRNSGKMSFFAACSGQLEFSTQANLHKEVKILFPLHTQLAEMHKCANWCRVRTGSMQCRKNP